MLSYRDKTFCCSKTDNHTCDREFTEEDKIKAEKWWGNKEYPVSLSKFCEES